MSGLPINAQPPAPNGTVLLRRATRFFVGSVWVLSLIFVAYIVVKYGVSIAAADISTWNDDVESQLYVAGGSAANAGIGLHFMLGALLMTLGSIQLMPSVRDRYRALHRLTGRVYVAASILTAIGGLTFVVLRGTVGGVMMNIGFGLYGVLMLAAGVETARHARAGRYDNHRAWAWRLYALVIASFLYRIEYGAWALFLGEAGMNNYYGPFDRVMNFFFFIPNLMVVEMLLRARQPNSSASLRVATGVTMVVACAVVLTGTFALALGVWLPFIFDVPPPA